MKSVREKIRNLEVRFKRLNVNPEEKKNQREEQLLSKSRRRVL